MKAIKINLSLVLETIFEDAEFQIGTNDKVGIVGVNGAGKTTLFNLILIPKFYCLMSLPTS